MIKLNFPDYEFVIKSDNNSNYIFDKIRKKYLKLTPEEWVRQNMIQYMINELGYSGNMLAMEHSLKLNNMSKRADIVAYNNMGEPIMIVECKAANVSISQKVFDQIARYNIILKVPYLVVTNGINHYCCLIDFAKGNYKFLNKIPSYSEISLK